MISHDNQIEPGTSVVRNAVHSDLDVVVKVHQSAFKGFFLDRMGPHFIAAYYQSVLDYRDSIFLVNVDQSGEVNGFAAGFINPDAFYDHFRARRLKLLPTIVAALLRRPSLFMDIARNTRRVTDTATSGSGLVELSSIGTSRRGAGVGAVLLDAFCARSAELGVDLVKLTTDRDDNASVLNFYLSHGFEAQGFEQRGTRVLQVMTRAPSSSG